MTTLVDCPESQRGTWTFRLLGTRVRVKAWFWITPLDNAVDPRRQPEFLRRRDMGGRMFRLDPAP